MDEIETGWTRREFVTGSFGLILEGAFMGAWFSRIVDGIRTYTKAPLVEEKLYLGEDIQIRDADTQIRDDEKAMAKNIVALLPKSEPYVDQIFASAHAYDKIFPVPAEIIASVIQQESAYNSRAISPVFAVGIAQFMRYTAKDKPFKMKTYDENSHPKLYSLEQEVRAYRKIMPVLEKDKEYLERKRDWKNLGKKLDEIDLVLDKNSKAKGAYDELFAELTPEDDERLDPYLSIQNATWYLALLARECRKKYGGNIEENIVRALSAYNAGIKKSARNRVGIAINRETRDYIYRITSTAQAIIHPDEWGAKGMQLLYAARQSASKPLSSLDTSSGALDTPDIHA